MIDVKLQSSDTLNNLKYYILLTNEYGLPSKSNINFFILNFGAVVNNGNFSRYAQEYYREEFDTWWQDVLTDLKERDMENAARFRGGYSFFKQLAQDSRNLRTQDALMNYLINFDVSTLENYQESEDEDNNAVDVSGYYHTGISAWVLERESITLICHNKNSNADEILELDTKSGAVKVKSSNMTRLIGNEYNSFEAYLIDYISPIGSWDEIKKVCVDVVNQIKQGNVWEVQIGIITLPLNKVFIWEDAQ